MEAVNRRLLQQRLAHCEALLRRHLPDWTWSAPAGGPSLWVRLPGADAARFAQVALRFGVEVIPGSSFATDGAFADHIRLPYTLAPETMTEAAGRLAQAWAAYSSVGAGEGPRRDLAVVV